MLTPATMGALALAIFWVNTLLIAASAAKEIARLAAKRRALGTITRGKVTGVERGGAFAELVIDQLGRMTGDDARPEIVFADRSATGRILGGTVDVGESERVVAASDGEVWMSPAEIERFAACPSPDVFEAALLDARRAKGHARTTRATVDRGAEVWLGDGFVATIDPLAWLRNKIVLASIFIVVALGGAAGVTALCLVTPRFGAACTAGGVLGLVFFLLIQPAGTALRDAVRFPHLRPANTLWRRDRSPAAELSSKRG